MRARPRPATAWHTGDLLKLHRHAVWLDGRRFTVIILRPGTGARFASSYYHRTWHVLSDLHGAGVLGRLLWGLAYQRGTGHADPARLGEHTWKGMDYTELGWPDGEVQVFTDCRRRVSATRVACREVLAALPGPLAESDLDPLIWARVAAIRARA
ncbi:MAG TPA: hypothetical protein VFV73_41310 [Streptosporangiaceae bacterium]|nr:hypothetical protein [Streptosporangiaceae bacterium]